METPKKRKRGRPRKIPPLENPEIVSEPNVPLVMSENKSQAKKPPITMQHIQNSLTSLFSEALGYVKHNNRQDTGIFNLNYFNPFLQNERLKMLTSTPVPYKAEDIMKALQSPQNHEAMLQQSSAALSASQYLYYKIIREAADIPLFKYFVIPPLLKKEEYNKPEFLDEEEYVDSWLEKFDVTNTLKRISIETKREGKPTYILRQSLMVKEGKKSPCYVTWQKLPPRFVKLTAIGEHGYIASFNLMLFLQPAFSPSQYPEFIQNIWADMLATATIYENPQTKKYEADLNKLRRYSFTDTTTGKTWKGTAEFTDNRYMYWIQLSQDMCFTFASDSSNAWAVPDTIGLFSALQELTDYSTLAGLVASTPLTAVLTGQAEFVPNAEVGQDQTCMSPHTMQAFQNSFDSMVSGNIAAFLAPFKDLKLQSLPNVPNSSDIKTKAVQNFVSTAGEGGLIAATDKPSVAMIKGTQLLAGSQYDFVTKQFQTILNDNLRRHAGLKYKWRVILWGDVFTFDNAVKVLKELVMGGASFLLPKLASAFDITMREVRGIDNYMDAFEIYDKFKPLNYAMTKLTTTLKTTNTNTTGTSNPVGRPPLEDGDVENENTAASKDAGNNVSEIKDFVCEGVCILCGQPVEEGHILCSECEEEHAIEGVE